MPARQDLVQVLAGQERLEQPDRGELDIVAPADGEREPVPGQRGIRRVGPDDDVRGGINDDWDQEIKLDMAREVQIL